MKKLLTLLALILLAIPSFSQTGNVKVTLKNGTQIQGQMKSIDPTKSVSIIIAGNPVEINISDVAKIEENTATTESMKSDNNSGQEADFLQTDKNDYPETITIKIRDVEIPMYLVRGGFFKMGFDGHRSLHMKSEPIHKVNVSSFYMSKDNISNLMEVMLYSKKENNKKQEPKEINFRKTSKEIESIQSITGKPLRLNTEAEWEYAARSPKQKDIFSENAPNWCSDNYEKYPETEQTDPTGPIKGRYQVARYYSSSDKKFDRSLSTSSISMCSYHLVLPVSSYK